MNSRGCYWVDTKSKYVIKNFFVCLYVQSYSKWRNKTSTRRLTSARTESRAEASNNNKSHHIIPM
ncbi:hypothetical protein SFRURICE_019840 [Spodoptera frugiperda]|nr:hypothetical protein SFRURICE_019840 [Spodoptera frugiperda]